MDEELPSWFKDEALKNFETQLPLNYKNSPVRFLQIGAYKGDASVWMVQNVLTHPESILVDVDTWLGSDEAAHHSLNWNSVEAEYDAKTVAYRNSRKILKYKSTSDYFFLNNREAYDFIYIDGDHTSIGVMKDAVHAYECLRTSGILAFDDYEWTGGMGPHNKPKMAIDAFLSIYRDRIEVIVRGYQLWVRKVY